MVTRVLLPLSTPLFPDRSQILVALPGRTRTVSLLPDPGIPARWNPRWSPALCARIVAAPFVIGPSSAHLTNLSLYALPQVRQGVVIRDCGLTGHIASSSTHSLRLPRPLNAALYSD